MSPWWWIPIGFGILIGLILLLLGLLLFTRTALAITYDAQGILLKIRVIGIPITLYPRKEKEANRKFRTKKTGKKTKTSTKPAEEKKTLSESLKHTVKEAKFSDYIKILRVILTEFVGKFGFEDLRLHISVGGEDASKIALTYGRINEALYPILGALSAANKLERCDIQITPDFTAETVKAEGHATFSVRLYHGIVCAYKLTQML